MEHLSPSVLNEGVRWAHIEHLLGRLSEIDSLLSSETDNDMVDYGLTEANVVAGDLSRALNGGGSVLVTAASLDSPSEPDMSVLLFNKPHLVGVAQRTDGTGRCELVFIDNNQSATANEDDSLTNLAKVSAEGLHIQPVFDLDPADFYTQSVLEEVSGSGTLDLAALDVKVAVMSELEQQHFISGIDDKLSDDIWLSYRASTVTADELSRERRRSYRHRPGSIDTTKGEHVFEGLAIESPPEGDTHLQLRFTDVGNPERVTTVAVRDVEEYQLLDE